MNLHVAGGWREQVDFRLFVMPCCGHQLCWVNPRLPNHCPECGQTVLSQLRTNGEHTLLRSTAWLSLDRERSTA